MLTLACYLLREDGEWYDLGNRHQWRSAIATFPGWPDGATILKFEDAYVLGIKLDGYDFDESTRMRIAADIIRWAAGKKFRFVSELCPEVVDPDVQPSPITGSVREAL